MQINLRLLLPLIIISLFIIQSCNSGSESISYSSAYSSKASHNAGKNCMSCHKQDATGETAYFVAGTIYDNLQTNIFPNATVKLFTGPNGTGTLKNTIQVDGLGNFYTTENITFGSGLYPAVLGSTTTKYMSTVITSGTCNGCHGITTDKIWTK